jgi:hypothetical protein
MRKLLATSILFCAALSLQAQAITLDELKKYIIAMDSIEALKVHLTETFNNLSKGNDKISSTRYHALVPVANDDTKLKDANATPEEIAYVKKAAAIKDEETIKFQKAFQSLIQDYVGEAVFTKVRNGLKTDPGLKKKYDSLIAKPIRP